MKKYSEKRKENRAGLKEFFEKHVQNILNSKTRCTNCGCRLIGDVSEVAHRLPKSLFKSVMLNDENIVYLCSYRSPNNCHSLYDGSNEQLWSLSIFEQERLIIEKLLEDVKEKYNWKLLDRWKL